jgi:cellulose synthase/poly-beta-1,6-N-acetylglucosamine synthase-like glycosyltransferase
MATAVLDVDVSHLPQSIEGLDGYESALALLRVAGRPAGQAVVPVVDGRIRDAQLTLMEAADSAFWEAWLRDHLGLHPDPVVPSELPRATVAICTRDRPDDLERCLAALVAMPDDGQEILVVDNAPSTDATRQLVARHPKVRYVCEKRPGLNVARNRALREARHEIVAFTDDDAAPDRLWLRTLLRNFRDPFVMASSGLTMALELETRAQVSFQRYGGFVRGFKRVVYDVVWHNPLLGWYAGAGVNMAVRRDIAERVGLFDEALDAGTPTCAGGESDMFRRILCAGYRIAYDPEALNWHRHRRTGAELQRQLTGYEIAAFAQLTRALLFEHNLAVFRQVREWLRIELRQLARFLLRRPGAPRRENLLGRWKGAGMGPWIYLYSHWRARRG